MNFQNLRKPRAIFYPKHLITRYSPRLVSFLPCQPPQDKIIDQLESDNERLKLEIFELKGDNKLLKMQLKECATKLQEQQGYYDDDGNYVE